MARGTQGSLRLIRWLSARASLSQGGIFFRKCGIKRAFESKKNFIRINRQIWNISIKIFSVYHFFGLIILPPFDCKIHTPGARGESDGCWSRLPSERVPRAPCTARLLIGHSDLAATAASQACSLPGSRKAVSSTEGSRITGDG